MLFSLALLGSCNDDDGSNSGLNPNDLTADELYAKWVFETMRATVKGVESPEVDYFGNQPGCNQDYLILFETSRLPNGLQHARVYRYWNQLDVGKSQHRGHGRR